MVSAKGILYTMLTAVSAAMIAGTLLTRKKGQQKSVSGWSFRNLGGSKSRSTGPASVPTQVENQSSIGHA